VQRQFVDIALSQQHRLTNLLSAIQHDVPPQPRQSYEHMPASESDGDSDDGFYLTSSLKTSSQYCAGIFDDDDDDDNDDSDDSEEKMVSMSSVCNQDDHVCSVKMSSQTAETVEPAADMDVTMSSSEDEDLAEFAAAFDTEQEPSLSALSYDVNTEDNLRPDFDCVAGTSGQDSAGDELTMTAWQQLYGGRQTCELKVEGIDDVSDFIPEFVHQPTALPAYTSGKIIISIN